MIEEIFFETHDEWAQSRRGRVGASSVPAILGISPFSTPLHEYRLLRGEIEPPKEDIAMRMGHLLEPIVANLFAEETGCRIKGGSEREYVVRNSDYPFAQVSPDRVVYDAIGNELLLECKTTSLRHAIAPVYWKAQVQWQLAVTGMPAAYVAWLENGREFHYQYIERDEETITWMAEQLRIFFENTQKGIEPEAVAADTIEMRFPTSAAGKKIIATDEISEVLAELVALKDTISSLIEREEGLKESIKQYLGDAEALEVDGAIAVTWKSQRDRMFLDPELVKTRYPDAFKECSKLRKGSRVFIVK